MFSTLCMVWIMWRTRAVFVYVFNVCSYCCCCILVAKRTYARVRLCRIVLTCARVDCVLVSLSYARIHVPRFWLIVVYRLFTVCWLCVNRPHYSLICGYANDVWLFGIVCCVVNCVLLACSARVWTCAWQSPAYAFKRWKLTFTLCAFMDCVL